MITEDALKFNRYKSTRELQFVRGDFTLRTTNTLNYVTREYKKLVRKRATYLLKEIKNGKNIIYSDIDTVWLKKSKNIFERGLRRVGTFGSVVPLLHGIHST